MLFAYFFTKVVYMLHEQNNICVCDTIDV